LYYMKIPFIIINFVSGLVFLELRLKLEYGNAPGL